VTNFPTETAKTVYERTYRREKPDGSLETWPETVRRVVDGNLALVQPRYIEAGERDRLVELIESFKLLPAGRHLKSSGVNDYALNNCWAAGWLTDDPAEHFRFTLLRLAEGGGVGSNYSSRYLEDMPEVLVPVEVHVVCDPDHKDYEEMEAAGLLSKHFHHGWHGAYAVEDSREGWADALADLIRTAHDPNTKHVHRVYDVSRVRPKGAALRKFGGTASGPAPFAEMLINVGKILHGSTFGPVAWAPLSGIAAMEIDHEIARCIVSGGVRRSARMSIMRWDDPLIDQFLQCKADMTRHWTTNISVEVNDEFQAALADGHMGAHLVLNSLAAGAVSNGEPGFWNSSLTAEGEVDGTFTTNPCGEATLNPWEPCNLGSVNLAEFVDNEGKVNRAGLIEAHRLITRYLIRATCAPVADPKSADAIARYRRIGVGHLGFADFIAKQGIRYSQSPYEWRVRQQLTEMADEVDEAAAEYANEMRIPVPIKSRVIAPTGTTSKIAGVSGEGIHLPFAAYFNRRIRFSLVEPLERAQVEEYKERGYHVEDCIYAANTAVVTIPTRDALLDTLLYPDVFEHAGDVTLGEMLAVQRMYQRHWADQAVSYTASVDPQEYSAEDVAELLRAFIPDLKGSTIFPEMSRAQAPYERITRVEYEARVLELGSGSSDTSYDEICASGACPI
jgi:ribonucleoside-triphosphate reductase